MSHAVLKDQSADKWKKASDKMPSSKLILLDGSMGYTLCLNGLPNEEGTLFTKIWAAAALADEKYHKIVVQAHIDYIESGSHIISTNSYATQPNYYKHTYGEDAYEALMLKHAKVRERFILFMTFIA